MADTNKTPQPAAAKVIDSPADQRANANVSPATGEVKLPDVREVAPQPPGVDPDKASLMAQTQSRPQPTKTLAGALEEIKHPEPVKPYDFNEKKFEAKVEKIRTSANDVEGKPNYNPHMYLKTVGYNDAVRSYKRGSRSQELYDTIMNLPDEVPVIDPDYVAPAPYKAELPKALQPPKRPHSA